MENYLVEKLKENGFTAHRFIAFDTDGIRCERTFGENYLAYRIQVLTWEGFDNCRVRFFHRGYEFRTEEYFHCNEHTFTSIAELANCDGYQI